MAGALSARHFYLSVGKKRLCILCESLIVNSMAIDDDRLQKDVEHLLTRPGHETVRAILYNLLVDGLEADLKKVKLEENLKDVRGRMDVLLGRAVFEIKSDLRQKFEDPKPQLLKYLQDKEVQTSASYIGIATDGSVFRVYVRTNEGKDFTNDKLERINEYVPNADEPRKLLIWLESVLALQEKLLPDGDIIEMELGRDSVFYRRSFKEIQQLWQDLRAQEETESETKYKEWQRLLNTAYIDEVDEGDLFLQHTYLTFIAKAIATVALIKELPSQAKSFLRGEDFVNFGVYGAVESDFFDWVLLHESGPEIVMEIARHVEKFDWSNLEIDILKILYESLINPSQRQVLGEYYTPDWLAEKVCRNVINDPLNMRILDPACGSGTFLFHAIRLFLEKAKEENKPYNEVIDEITTNISGIDVHPVAVIFARVTYLLALSPFLQTAKELKNVSIPVYLGNSLQWDIRKSIGDTEDLEIIVPAIEQENENGNGRVILRFPATVAKDRALFDEIINVIMHHSDRDVEPNVFNSMLIGKQVSESDAKEITKTYSALCLLKKQKRNHIWGYIARNLSRPLWLAGETQKADVVIGNPPWRSYRKMGTAIQNNYKEEMVRMELWSNKATSTQDFACYCFARCMELYMKNDGQIAFVMPLAIMTRQPSEKLRSGRFLNKDFSPYYFSFTKAWALPSDVKPLFPVPACVLFAKKTVIPQKLPDEVTYFHGELPKRNASIEQAKSILHVKSKPWPSEEKVNSPYAKKFGQGAIFIPRKFVLIEKIENTLKDSSLLPMVRGRAGILDKEPWKSLTPPENVVESNFIHPIYLGASIAPYRVIGAYDGVVAWDKQHERLMSSELAFKSGYHQLSKWLKQVEEKWGKHRSSEINFEERIDHFKKVSMQFPIAKIRVAYATSGTQPAATIIRDTKGLIDTSLYWTEPENLQEAYYLIAILNSETARAAAEQWQAEGQWGRRHFAKSIFNLPIPKFDEKNSLHNRLAESAKKAEKLAAKIPVKEGEYFTGFRKRIRIALQEDGIANEIDQQVADLLGITRKS